MLKATIKFLMVFIFLIMLSIKATVAQKINKAWYSSGANVCFTITDSNSQINELNRLKVKQKENSLKIVWASNQTFYGWHKESYIFNIEKLNDDSLVLSQVVLKNKFELLPDSITRFKSMSFGCIEKWKVVRRN